MAEDSLFDHQKDLLREMVRAYKAGCGPDFMPVGNSMFSGIVLIGKNGRQQQIQCAASDLAALEREGLIQLTTVSSGTMTPRAIRAVDGNFASSESPAPSPISIGNIVQHLHGATVQNAIGSSITQSVEVTIGNIWAELKVSGVPQSERNHIEDLMDAWKETSDLQQKSTIVDRFKDWCARNSGNLSEAAGRFLKGYFGDGS
jgi:hypothetical protein